ncbi:MAG: SH3 domain-containing protein [Pseudooceanicola nanhaiensis]
MRALGLALALAAGAASAQESVPAFYDVEGVAADDVLNVRREPDPGTPIIGTLAHDATRVEVTELRPRLGWGRVNTAEGSGWVSMDFMERVPGQDPGTFPAIARCSGTEPFWTLSRDGTTYSFGGPDLAGIGFTTTWRGTASGRRDRYAAMLQSGRAGRSKATAVIARQSCSDGMSDRHYGFTLDLVITGAEGEPRFYSGCCSLAE